MIVERKNLSDGSCNFCDRSKLSVDGRNLIFPYKKVTHVSSDKSGLSARFCDECLKLFKKLT